MGKNSEQVRREGERLDREFAATVLFEAAFASDGGVAEKYGISVKTIYRYRLRLGDDLLLAGLVAAKRRAFEQATEGLPAALVEALNRLEEMAGFARDGHWVSPSSLEGVARRLRAVLCALPVPAGQALPAPPRPADRRREARPAHEKW